MDKNIEQLIKMALTEDLQEVGDVTSQAIFSSESDEYSLVSKDNGVLCGLELFREVFRHVDEECLVEFYFKDGERLEKGDLVGTVKGKVLSLLTAERTALNFLSNLSGIATRTALFVEKSGGKIKILDTRKTIPGYRELAKYAVSCGGGTNHRIGLYDMVMIKDNHTDAAGSITEAVKRVRERWGGRYKIEVETRNIAEVEEALRSDVDRIMLDNMDIETMKSASALIAGRAEIEVSGNVTLERVEELSQLKIDFVSIGELTHTIRAFDFSLKKI